MSQEVNCSAPREDRGTRLMPQCRCGILHGSEAMLPVDNDGCLLEMGHDGPHEFVDPKGQHWQWETDMECDCEHCMRCEGDYCTVYWKKPRPRLPR